MNNTFEIVQANIEDLEPLTVLFNEYRIFYQQHSDLEGARSFLFNRIAHRESILFLVRDREMNTAVGFTQLYPSFSSISMKRSWILNDLFVTEAYRGRGAAQLLLDTAKEYAEQTHAKGLALSTAIDNERAQAIYERNGYKRDDEFYSYYLTL
jgi:ribosomal protein S18 acetylase RimI-like enzyme